MTKDLHPGLGSGALREALEHTAKLFHRFSAYVSHTSPHAGVTFEDCMEVECVENRRVLALSLSSPIEPKTPVDEPKNDDRAYGCYTCGKQGLKKGQRVSLVYCNECDAKHIEEVRRAARPQASSEVREAQVGDDVLLRGKVRYFCESDDTVGVKIDGAMTVTVPRAAALAPSRQGAGGK